MADEPGFYGLYYLKSRAIFIWIISVCSSFALRCSVIGLEKTYATFSSNQMQNQNKSRLIDFTSAFPGLKQGACFYFEFEFVHCDISHPLTSYSDNFWF